MNEGHSNRQINSVLSIIQYLFAKSRWSRWLRFAVLGLLIAVSLHAGIAVAVKGTRDWLGESTGQQVSARPHYRQISVTSSSAELMQQAEDLYQVAQLSEAIALWQQAMTRYQTAGDRLNQALVLSFLATAWDDLGQWTQANEAINRAISLLNIQNSASHSDLSSVLAQVLTIQGKLQLTQGKISEALETWQASEVAYRKANDTVGIIGSQINQARALQAEGLYRRARLLLTQVEQSLQNQPNSRLKLIGLRNLGKVLRLVGDLARARTVLQQSLEIAQKLRDKTPQYASDISGILLSLGNTTRAQGETDAALAFYQRAATIAPSLTQKTQIQLVQLSLLVEADHQADVQRLWTEVQSQIAKLPVGRLAVYARINLAQSSRKMSIHQTEKVLSPHLLKISAQELATAIEQVHSIGDHRAESYALGTLGSLYETTHQWEDARMLTQKALKLAQSIDAPDIAYQWQWQLGRILCQDTQPCTPSGNLQNATVAYAEAVKTLQSLRSDLVAVNQDVQFSFRESVEPVYRQFVELLLQSQTNPPSQKNLNKAREVIEALQLAELDNFFKEACINARPVKIDQIDSQAAVIYPIILPNQLAVILSLPHQPLRYYKTPLPQTEVEGILSQMRQALRPTAFVEDWLPVSQQVYNLLLRPMEIELAASGVKTLVFVPDGLLRLLPMAALHDGQQYLIEKYRVVLGC